MVDSNTVEKHWELVATVENNIYNDNEVGPGKAYNYRVKAVASRSELIENSGAESLFSDTAEIQL